MVRKPAGKPAKKSFPWVKVLWAAFAAAVLSIVLVFVLISSGVIGYLPDIEELKNPKNKFATELYTADGEMFGRFFYGKDNRVAVEYDEISPYVVQALVATEDVRYYNHSGIDFKALVRSIVFRVLLGQKNAGGGSTISQQLAKQLYSPVAENIVQRALQKPIEWVIAVKLERYYTKEEIIAMYLNQFDFLNNAVGIKSAAQVYFNTTPDKLDIEQSAMLVGMCQNPSYYNPNRFPERTQKRRNLVLQRMQEAGFLSLAESDSLQALPIRLDFKKVDHKTGIAPYFREFLRLTMTADKPDRKDYASWQGQQFYEDSIAWENDPLFGWCNKNFKPDGSPYNIYTDGLKVYTTIDSRMQVYAEQAVSEHVGGTLQQQFFKENKGKWHAPFSTDLTRQEINEIMDRAMRQSERYIKLKRAKVPEKEIEKIFSTPVEMRVFNGKTEVDTLLSPIDSIRWDKYFLRCGFMSMDPRSGHVKAYVGGPNFAEFQYDMVSKGKRQIGSTIKPFLYTLAMEEGAQPCDLVANVQPTVYLPDGNVWKPRNSSDKRIGEMVTLSWGLQTSNNWISAHLIKKYSPQALVNLMHSFGILGFLDPVVSLCLGPAEVSVKEMVSAYTAFVNEGIMLAAVYVTRIEDNKGNEIASFTARSTEVISKETADEMVLMLQNVVDKGTGIRLRYRYKFQGAIGGKTGTTQNNSDGWFMGFTPELVNGVWVGGEDRSIHFDNMRDGQGASMALPVWALYMQKVYADSTLMYCDTLKFNIPEEIAERCDCEQHAAITKEEDIFGFFE